MKTYSRLLSLALALMLVLSGIAFAEEELNSTLYMLSIYDPILYANDQPVLDLTGANLDLYLAATDTEQQALVADLFVGDDPTYVTSLTAQLDGNGASLYLDGMENAYGVDLASLLGMNPAEMVSAMQLRTLLNSADLSGAAFESYTAADRLQAVNAILAPFVTLASQTDSNTVYNLVITDEQSAEILAQLGQLLDELNAFEVSDDLEDFTFNLAGTVTVSGDPSAGAASIAVNAAGLMTESGSDPLPVTLDYSDDMSAYALNVNILSPDGAHSIALTLNGAPDAAKATVTEDGREIITLDYTSVPDPDSDQVDTSVVLSIPDEEASMSLSLSTGLKVEDMDVGVTASLSVTEGDDVMSLDLEYYGQNLENETVGAYHVGWLSLRVAENDESYAIELSPALLSYDESTDYWAIGTDGAVDLTTMSSDQQEAAMTEVTTLFSSFLPVLQENIPGLASFLGTAE